MSRARSSTVVARVHHRDTRSRRNYSSLGRRGEALKATQEATGIYRDLAKDRPKVFLPDLAMALGAHSLALERRIPTFRIGARDITGRDVHIQGATEVRQFRRGHGVAMYARAGGDLGARVLRGAGARKPPRSVSLPLRPWKL